ncbi:hypothetical protein BKI51_23760 (plasmid) [Alphaproteobacteria bacterium AO1-B]|nr:hypothetical protein BKI51_23760 [Alphaproteobacteria bacterium AO1-B]
MDLGSQIDLAKTYAAAGRFDEMLATCRDICTNTDQVNMLLATGALLAGYGFLSDARAVYQCARNRAPTDLRAQVNLANLAREAAEHSNARSLYEELQQKLPNHPVIRRNALVGQEYDPGVSDFARKSAAIKWGRWAIAQAGGFKPRPAFGDLESRPLRVGYVSGDICQHTVGLFVKDVLKAHNPERVVPIVYSAGMVKDWVTNEVAAACTLHDVSSVDDVSLADQIRLDNIDVLVDLSGHTGGSRLTVFAYRPTPVMISWLGYFATTGLQYIDAVILDAWHASDDVEDQFIEPIVKMNSRFCYKAVPWMPEVAIAPVMQNGYVTFGSFNNTAKLNDGVIEVWSKILAVIPDARLILKWRTFNDADFRQRVSQAFADRGIAADRIELRGPSFHADLLKEYGDIDIALDPFPFTGGLTSCEALYCGVPVVTVPQSRVVSRQTFAFLNQIGLQELAAEDMEDYISISVELASNSDRLKTLRASLRSRMISSPLMDVQGFTRELEDRLIRLYHTIQADE